MKKYSTILFDWDNCLACTGDFWVKGFEIVFERHGIKTTDTKEIFLTLDKTAKKGINPIDKTKSVEDFWLEVAREVEILNQNVILHPNTKEVLNELKKSKHQLALISSSTRAAIYAGLTANLLESIFDTIVAAEDVENHKPDPEPLIKALKFFNTNPSEAIMIGDKDLDVFAAKAAGVDSVLYLPELNRPFWDFEEFKKSEPTYIIQNLSDLLTIITN